MTKRVDELVHSICGTSGHPLTALLRRWCEESRSFLAFAEAHDSKIRKKARLASSEDELSDLLSELVVAASLLRDRRFSLIYEPLQAAGGRGPDFQVTLRDRFSFLVEVTRPRLVTGEDPNGALKLARIIGDKIGQFPPGAMNLLAVVVPLGGEPGALVPAAVRLLDQRAAREGSVPDLRPEGVRDYQRLRGRLSAIALCSFTDDWRPQTVTLWRNPQAKHPLHPEVGKYLASRTD